MKRIVFSALTLVLATAAFAPTAHAGVRSQVSTPDGIGEGTSFVEFVRFNRDVRHK